MNTHISRWLLSAVLAGCMQTYSMQAQPFQLEHMGIGTGGGTSSGGPFTLTGSMGALGSGFSTGGSFNLESGDLAMFVVLQTAGAPALSLSRSGGNAVLSWPVTATDYVLEQKNALTDLLWGETGISPVTAGDRLQVTLPITGTSRFFRLRRLEN